MGHGVGLDQHDFGVQAGEVPLCAERAAVVRVGGLEELGDDDLVAFCRLGVRGGVFVREEGVDEPVLAEERDDGFTFIHGLMGCGVEDCAGDGVEEVH